jgi:hypothetical protein
MIVGGCCTGGEISLGGIFTCGIFNFLFACNSTTKGTMVKWGKQLDLAGRKGSEITLEGALIVVKGGFTSSCGKKTSSSGNLSQIGNCFSEKQFPI